MTPYPNHPAKQDEPALVEPAAYISYLERVGRGPGCRAHAALLCYEGRTISRLRSTRGLEPVAGVLGSHIFTLPAADGGRRDDVVVAGRFGIGAPGAAAVVEELIAMGCGRFVSVGTAGALQPELAVGDLVVADRAIRDEGTSYHYLAAAKYADPSPELTACLRDEIERAGRRAAAGTTWTTDAVYRETVAEAAAYRAEGVAVVEMEAAAVFAVCAYRRVEAAAAFTVSDSLTGATWSPEFYRGEVETGVEILVAAGLAALAGS
jgi:uridine phosphorylase